MTRSVKYGVPPGDLSRRNGALLAMVGWALVPFRRLSEGHKGAIAVHYTGPRLAGMELEKKFGRSTLVGCSRVPMLLFCLMAMNDPDRKNSFDSFDEYHRYYLSREKKRMKEFRSRWPVVLSGRGRDRETIVDGWHRFHSYYMQGVKHVPVIWYAEE